MIVGSLYCGKCGKILTLNHYPFRKTISEELDRIEGEHTLHLCVSCTKIFPTCNAQKIKFGSCHGNDNVIECDAYEDKGDAN